jgi:hypothetical protein
MPPVRSRTMRLSETAGQADERSLRAGDLRYTIDEWLLGYRRKRPRPKYPSSKSTTSTITMIQIRSIRLSLYGRHGERSRIAPHRKV